MGPIYNEGLEKIKKSFILRAFPPSLFSAKTCKASKGVLLISFSWENKIFLLDTLAHRAMNEVLVLTRSA
jgi:hypothetical protein